MSDLLANGAGAPSQTTVASFPTEASSWTSANQLVFLDHDGAQDVSYRGPIPIENLDIPGLDLSPFGRAGEELELIETIAKDLNARYASDNVRFVTDPPAAGPYSTIYIGGDNDAFAQEVIGSNS